MIGWHIFHKSKLCGHDSGTDMLHWIGLVCTSITYKDSHLWLKLVLQKSRSRTHPINIFVPGSIERVELLQDGLPYFCIISSCIPNLSTVLTSRYKCLHRPESDCKRVHKRINAEQMLHCLLLCICGTTSRKMLGSTKTTWKMLKRMQHFVKPHQFC